MFSAVYHGDSCGLEQLAALQAAALAAWRNQSAKRAHSLRLKVSILRVERGKQLCERISDKHKPFAHASAEAAKLALHRATLTLSPLGILLFVASLE
jgi:hypothetical protein